MRSNKLLFENRCKVEKIRWIWAKSAGVNTASALFVITIGVLSGDQQLSGNLCENQATRDKAFLHKRVTRPRNGELNFDPVRLMGVFHENLDCVSKFH